MTTNFGERLRQLRKRANKRQADVASALGLAQTTVSALERRESAPRESVLQQLCDYYNVAPSYFFEQEQDRSAERQAALAYIERIRRGEHIRTYREPRRKDAVHAALEEL